MVKPFFRFYSKKPANLHERKMPRSILPRQQMLTLQNRYLHQHRIPAQKKEKGLERVSLQARSGAGNRGRTDTISLPRDFESRASANSAIPATYLL